MKEFHWESYDGRNIVLCGPFRLSIPILIEMAYRFRGIVRVCDDEYANADTKAIIEDLGTKLDDESMELLCQISIQFISCDELFQFRDDYVILVGKTFFKDYCKALGYTGLRDFYSAVPILMHGWVKHRYFSYFTPLYHRQKSEGVLLGGVEINVTKACSLRCKDCANLIQYYDRPGRIPSELILDSVRHLLDCVDGIGMFKIMGGEPLLEQDLICEILSLPELVSGQKVLGIQIITNGTIPFQEKLLKCMQGNPLMEVLLSNYGELSTNEGTIIEQLEAYHIPIAVIGLDDTWRDYGDPRIVHQTPEKAAWLFRRCKGAEHCCTLLDGKLYDCPRAAHGEALGFYRPENGASVDLVSEPWNRERAREQIQAFRYRTNFPEACLHCKNLFGDLIERAIQV